MLVSVVSECLPSLYQGESRAGDSEGEVMEDRDKGCEALRRDRSGRHHPDYLPLKAMMRLFDAHQMIALT